MSDGLLAIRRSTVQTEVKDFVAILKSGERVCSYSVHVIRISMIGVAVL